MSEKKEAVVTPAEARLRERRAQLITLFLAGKAPDFLEQHARLLDDYFFQRFETSRVGPDIGLNKNPFAILALGGYGRQEQCIHSDVDLLFLFQKKIPHKAEALIQEVVYPLWDIGCEVGYAIRSMKECLQLAGKDYEVLTSLLDARVVCGVSRLYLDLMSALGDRVFRNREKDIIGWLVERNRDRHLRFGDSSYLLEPNLKEGQGGLRDYHTMLWIARIRSNLREPRDLEYDGYLSHEEYQRLLKAVTFIWRVRNHLHQLARRKCDQLYFEHQRRLADELKFTGGSGLLPVEAFLGTLHGHMAEVKQIHEMFLYESGVVRRVGASQKPQKTAGIKGIAVERGALGFSSPKRLLKTPHLLIDIFGESLRLKIPLGAEARRLIRDFLHLVDEGFRKSPHVLKTFEKILKTRETDVRVLDDMLGTGFLTRLIPELAAVANRIQFDDYHLFPVDRHLLRTVEILRGFSSSSDLLCATLYIELKKKKLLLWAGLLHDIGKGQPGEGHSETGSRMVSRIFSDRGMKPKDIETVAFLVQYHLYLFEVATRRDIQDEETALFCAREIKDVDRLKMLYLLSVADAMATGPKAWNDWTATLLRDLFLKILTTLERGELASRRSIEGIEGKKEAVLNTASTSEARQLLVSRLEVMSPRYLLYTAPQEILEHIRLFGFLGGADFVWEVSPEPESDMRVVTICAKDRPGLLSKIAGVFTLNGLNILDVQVYTWRNNIALDIFKVDPPPDQIFETERWSKAENHLKSALNGTLELGAALRERMAVYRSRKPSMGERPPHVVVDNTSSSFFTLIEVYAYDFPGLLFLVTDALFRCRLDVWVAKIGTKVDQVVDVFYVRDFDGQKVDSDAQVAEIKTTVMEVIENPS